MNRSVVVAASISFVAAATFVGRLAADFIFTPLTPPPRLEPISAMPIAGGADIIVGVVGGIQNWGGLGGLGVYSAGATVCNTGDVQLSVVQFTDQHPIASQNIHRVSTVDGASRIEQLGQGWVFHFFCSLQQSVCGTCIPAGPGCQSALGVGCSNPETPARMGTQNNLGPRYQVNASTGEFLYPSSAITGGVGVIGVTGKRVVVPVSDLDPAQNPGATYFSEITIVQPQDALAGNGADNMGHRKLNVGGLAGTPPNQYYSLALSGPTFAQQPAIHAWQVADPTVALVNVDVPADGRFVLGYDVTDLGDGTWHYEYAILNINSHRSGQAFRVPIPEGVAVTNIGFKDVDYHTQQILDRAYQVDNVDWTAALEDGALTWSTSPYSGPSPAGNENTANALRWGTMYNFRFDADAPPATVAATLALFRPGTPDSVSVEVLGPYTTPECPADLSGDGQVNGIDLALLLGAWGNCPIDSICGCPSDLDCSGETDGFDLATLLAAWGEC